MTTSIPRDNDARLIAANELDVPLCVEAAAGTGKTKLMEDRVAQIIRGEHARIDQVVAITFTDAAAAELRARIRARLSAESSSDKNSEPERQRFRTALTSLDNARIETIHAFAQSLLRERPVEAGIDPRFDVLDQVGMQVDFDEAWDEWFEEAVEAESTPVERALLLDFPFSEIRLLARVINHNRDVIPFEYGRLGVIDLPGFRRRLAEATVDLEDLAGECIDDSDAGWRQISEIRDFNARVQEASDEEALYIIASDFKIKGLGTQDHWRSADVCRRQKKLGAELGKEQAELAEAVRSRALVELTGWLERFPGAYSQRRRRQGKLDFDDLLVFTRDLLRDNKAVRQYFQQRFRYLLVDEFQDTDPLQVEIVFFLAERSPATADDWRKVNLDGGKLFVVGDPKQSIYRFRRADIAIYDAAKKAIAAQGKIVELFQNFRSADPILEWTNRVFAEQMVHEDGVQAGYIPLQGWPERQQALSGPSIAMLQPTEHQDRSDDTRRDEARALASLIQNEIIGHWEVVEDEGVRVAQAKDVLVLIPSRTKLEIYEQILQEWGLVYRHEGGNFFYQRQEIRDLIACLSAVDNPSDERAVVATLRHIYGLADEDLVLFRAAGGSFNYRKPIPGGYSNSTLELAYAELRDFHQKRNDITLGSLVEYLIAITRVIELHAVRPEGRQAVANIQKLAQLARQYESQPAATLHRYARWLRENRDGLVRESDSPFGGNPGKEVTILTMHAAKGLEFPIVILANLSTQYTHSEQAHVDREPARIYIKRHEGKFKTPDFDNASLDQQTRQQAERVRLLYVAATRARDHLVVSAYGKRQSPNQWIALLNGGLSEIEEIPAGRLPQQPLLSQEIEPEDKVDVSTLIATRESWLAAREELLGGLSFTRLVSATSLAHEADAAQLDVSPGSERLVSAEPAPSRLPTPASRLGSALHRAIERLDLRALPAELTTVAGLVAREYQVGDSQQLVERMLHNFSSSQLLKRVLAADDHWKEVPFAMARDGRLLEGFVDLVIREPDGLVLVDFKSDNVPGAGVGERAGGYRLQACLYALACEELTGQKVKEFVFYFARPDAAVTLQGQGLADEGREALAALDTIM
ncbi:MAG: UvrD-helicase domain-containing protein [Dehalococcoidia bacterium]